MTVKAVIDTNIRVSSLINPFGFPARLRKSFEDGNFHAVISAPMLDKLSEVLSRPRIREKYGITENDITGLLSLIEEQVEDVAVSGDITLCRDKDDDLVIETAIKGKAEYLVTRDDDIKFDKKVLSFLKQHNVTVISLSKISAMIDKS